MNNPDLAKIIRANGVQSITLAKQITEAVERQYVLVPLEHIGELTDLMQACAQAGYDDAEFNAPVYDGAGRVAGANGVNSHEAAMALNSVAAILGIPGPSSLLDDMYGDADS